ncbi:MAG: hypothetical protein JWM91_4991 [Rhodospirillales bacterium]|nr:hypothetical protein [Rhodospirillales bacterium]
MKTILSGIALVLTLSFGIVSISDAAPHCSKGKPCGDSCIAKDKECHVGAPADTTGSKAMPGTKTMTATKEPTATKECKSGKLCGDTCIAKNKTCNK